MLAFLLAAAVTIPPGLDLYLPVPDDNPLTAEKIEMGRRLFFDRRLSRDRSLSCASCHDPKRGFTDGRRVAIGVRGRKGARNAPALINRGYGRLFFWDGRATSLEQQVLQPITNPRELDLTLPELESRLGTSPADVARALASYVRSILSGGSPFDRYQSGDSRALGSEALRGMAIFRGHGNCTACHVGPNFSDEKLHNTGVAWRNGRLTDPGSGNGAFKTPTLREAARTVPYMHDGSLKTLEQVIDYYDRGGNPNPYLDHELRPLHLAREDKKALAAFLRSLSGSISGELSHRPRQSSSQQRLPLPRAKASFRF